MHIVARQLVSIATDQLHLAISNELASATGVRAQKNIDASRVKSTLFRTSGINNARAAVAEVTRLSRQDRVALLVDGLEKLLPGPGTREIFDALSQLPESVDLIVVIPWHAAFGGGAEPILRGGERLHRVLALDTDGVAGIAAAHFFERVLARRLLGADALPEPLEPLLGHAFKASGGIPRVFLQLVADAGTYARVKRGEAWPDDSDLREAIVDQQDSFRRTLLPGDTQAIMAVEGTDGRELDLDRRVRLLAQGILLERVHDGRTWLQIHPLVVDAIQNSRS